jgi:hypothetical protein
MIRTPLPHVVHLALLAAASCAGAELYVGANGGWLFTKADELGLSFGRNGATSSTALKRASFGPSISLRNLPWGLSVEASAFRRGARRDELSGLAEITQDGFHFPVWEVPLIVSRPLVPARFPIRPVLGAGAALRILGNGYVDRLEYSTFPNTPVNRTRFSATPEAPVQKGLAVQGGVDFRLGQRWLLSPGVRYTHWTSKHFNPGTEQLDFVLGLHFRLLP